MGSGRCVLVDVHEDVYEETCEEEADPGVESEEEAPAKTSAQVKRERIKPEPNVNIMYPYLLFKYIFLWFFYCQSNFQNLCIS